MALPLIATQQRFTADDGVELSYHVWSRVPASECKALVLILHGIGFHGMPYAVVAESMNISNAAFAALDFRGHGGSGGAKGEMADTQRMLRDIQQWVGAVRASFPEVPVFLIAESMAGPYGVLYSLENPGALDGLVLVAPAVLISWRQVFHSNTLSALRKLASESSSPLVDLGGPRLYAGSRNTGFISMRTGDSVSMPAVSPRYIWRVARAIARLALLPRLPVTAPVLIIHGAHDNILSPLGSRLLSLRLDSSDKGLLILPGAYHTLFWDDSSPAVFTIIEAWINHHIP